MVTSNAVVSGGKVSDTGVRPRRSGPFITSAPGGVDKMSIFDGAAALGGSGAATGGARADGGWGGSSIWRRSTPMKLSAWNGTSPVSISYRMQPAAYTSVR